MAILLNNNFEFKVSVVIKDDDANFLQLLVSCNELNINMINIYAPNNDQPEFFTKVFEAANYDGFDHVVLCGDFNLVLDPIKDAFNCKHINNPKARLKVIERMAKLEMVDTFRHMNPDEKRYTWRKKIPVKQARLDYFLVPNSFKDIVETIDIKPGYRSDHSIVEMQINTNKFSQGSGIWKFNNSLLKNQDYLNLINKVIIEEI